MVSFQIATKHGLVRFQTTKTAAGGCLQAERIARLCWTKLKSGVNREVVEEYRNQIYKKLNPPGAKPRGGQVDEPPAKKRRTR